MRRHWDKFFKELAANNNRIWFAAHKHEYEALRLEWYDDLARLIAAMSEYEPGFARLDPREATYRIYRDTRFSPDKTPYKVYLSASLADGGRKSPGAGYYIQADFRPGEGGLYAGIHCPETSILRKLRKAIADNIEEFEHIVNTPEMRATFGPWYGECLKTAPKGWPKDHPAIHYLRMKEYGKYLPLDATYFSRPEWPGEAAQTLRILSPLVSFINYSINEEV